MSWLAVVLVMDGSLRDIQGRQAQLDIERAGRAANRGPHDGVNRPLYSANTKIIVALRPRLRFSGVVARRPIELRVRPVAIAMYCRPSTA